MEDSPTAPMVSVVMLVYNAEKYIGRAIAGVARQRVSFPVQLVICDDVSTDGTERIIRDWMRRSPGLIDYYRNSENIGVQRNYLQAFRHCRGRYLTMCDGDDYWFDRTKLRRQVEYMEAHPECAMCYHRVVNFYEDTGEKSLSNGGGCHAENVSDLAASNTVTNLSVMYRAGLVDLHALPEWLERNRLLDYAMHILYASHGTVHYMDRPMGVYRKRSDAIWSMAGERTRLRMAFDVRESLLCRFRDREDISVPLRRAAVDHLVALYAAGEEEFAVRKLEETDFGMTPDELRRRGECMRSATPRKKGLVARVFRWFTRFIPLPRP